LGGEVEEKERDKVLKKRFEKSERGIEAQGQKGKILTNSRVQDRRRLKET